MRRESFVRFRCQYLMNLNSLSHCKCVHRVNISAAAGLEPGTPGNHATNELSWRHMLYINSLTFEVRYIILQEYLQKFCENQLRIN